MVDNQNFSITEIRKIIALLEESSLNEIEIGDSYKSIKVRRGSAAPQNFAAFAPIACSQVTGPFVDSSPQPSDDLEGTGQSTRMAPAIPDGHVVKSPMTGTFYSAPAPGSEPFVKIGSQIKVGDVLCIVEAMKMLNQIEADRSGHVVAILAEDTAPVNSGSPLFLIR
ncbi:MAG: acetyl-CoA carboxylase biotin carboxyl carrier protein [Spongiibacteraceae bacterium]